MSQASPFDAFKASQILTLPDSRLLGFAEYGKADGIPLMALHGTPESRTGFSIFHSWACSRGIRLICPERPGLGLSSPRLKDQPGFYDPILAHADDLATLAVHLGIQQRWGVIGGSGGGPYALACAYRASKLSSSDDQTVENVEAWRGLAAVGCCIGVGPPDCGVAGMSKMQAAVVTMIRWIPGVTGWIVGSSASAARNPDPRVLEKAFDQASRLLPPQDVVLLEDQETKKSILQTARETFRQGWEGAANESEILFRGFKDKKTGRWGWGFDVEDIEYVGRDGQGVRLWYGTKDRHVPARHGKELERRIRGSKYVEFDETHFGIGLNVLKKVFEDMLQAMSFEASA